ncbi:MAG: VCBS repeat-containing protein [Proteobacteria bacterium]|nr:VCBS repeat-containing protein [Pseudomonadota bacterium]MBU1741974.1 VCBS repeat-containing protein [Pseudomonadota bacterium]
MKRLSLLTGLAALAVVLCLPVNLRAAVIRVAVLPFNINAPRGYDYLRRGLTDMLATRLAWPGRVEVIDRARVEAAVKRVGRNVSRQLAIKVGHFLGADYVLFGSLTKVGQGISLDAQIINLSSKKTVLSLSARAPKMDNLIPRVDTFAKRINRRVFGRGPGGGRAATGPTGHPGSGVSPLSPLYLRILGGLAAENIWRSPRFNEIVEGLAFADLDKDGKFELVVLFQHSLSIYRMTNNRFVRLFRHKVSRNTNHLFVDAADINGNGYPEIFVSAVRGEQVASYVLEYRGGRYRVIVPRSDWYFRVVKMPMRRATLYGQQKAVGTVFLDGTLSILKWGGAKYVAASRAGLPRGINIFNFAMADIDHSGGATIAYINPSFLLYVVKPNGQLLWESESYFARSAKAILVPTDTHADREKWYYFPARMRVYDLNGDGRSELMVIQHRQRGLDSILKVGTAPLNQGSVICYIWNKVNLVQLWRTQRLSGRTTDFIIGPLNNDGKLRIVLAVAQKGRRGLFAKRYSHLISFDLDVNKLYRGRRR